VKGSSIFAMLLAYACSTFATEKYAHSHRLYEHGAIYNAQQTQITFCVHSSQTTRIVFHVQSSITAYRSSATYALSRVGNDDQLADLQYGVEFKSILSGRLT
jgi:isoamylase